MYYFQGDLGESMEYPNAFVVSAIYDMFSISFTQNCLFVYFIDSKHLKAYIGNFFKVFPNS